jgi:hypothetical protein
MDESKERFSKLESQVIDISSKMATLMATLENKFGSLGSGRSNSEVGSYKKSRDNENPKKELKRDPNKERLSLSAITSSQYLFKVEVKVDIKPCQDEIDVLKLNRWLQQLEVYFSVNNIGEDKNISFVELKLEGHAQIWWEIHTKMIRVEGDPLVTKWEVFETLINSQFYPIRYCYHLN